MMRLPPRIEQKFKPKAKKYPRTDSQKPRVRFFIYCEGECSEVNYFEGFNALYKNIDVRVAGEGYNTTSLVKRAIGIKEAIENKFKDRSDNKFDYSWVVFDKDGFSNDQFNNAIKKANANKFECAWSNEAFELWYLLHFEYINTGMKRNDYKTKLSKHLEEEYKKNDTEIFNKLKTCTEPAIKNGEKLEKMNENKQPCDCNPGTMVHKLVEQILNENKKFES